MPLTPAHAAAAWPLSRFLPRLPLEPLLLGTLIPDFQYFAYVAPRGRFSHSMLGLLLFCLPVGLIAWAIYIRWARGALLSLLPSKLRPGVAGAGHTRVLVGTAILLGAASHSVWDSFTHRGGWAVRHFPELAATVQIGDRAIPLFRLLQHGSTILGLTVVLGWILLWLRGQPIESRSYANKERSQAAVTAALLLASGAVVALANGWRGIGHGAAVMLGYAAVGGMMGIFLSLIILGIIRRADVTT